MRAFVQGIVVLIATLWLCSGNAWALGHSEKIEAPILARLKVRSPKAVAVWKEATAAMDHGRLAEAARKYREVLRLAPDFPDALRRLGYVEPNVITALALARKAYRLAPTKDNLAGVILVLLRRIEQTRASKHPPWQPRDEAKQLYEKLVRQAKDDAYTYMIGAQMALSLQDRALLGEAVSNLRRLAPDAMQTHYFAGIDAILNKDWETAEREIKRAQELGLPAAEARRLLDETGVSSKARRWRMVRYTGYTAAGWAIGLILLLLAGVILSRLTLSTVQNASPTATSEPTAGMKIVRKVYAGLLGLTSLYFYLSIPMVILLVLAAGGSVIYGFYSVGRIPIQITLVIVIGMLVTIGSMLKSLFVRRIDLEPGERLPENKAPELYAALREVASKVDTRPVDTVYVVPDTTLAVMERGSFWKRYTGNSERCLILGLGALEGLSQIQLKAILAHEYGHFSNKDTAGGDVALHVRKSVAASAQGMAEGGAAVWYNPAWLFLHGFYRIFLRVSQGASRLQEVLADRWAVVTYGSVAFVEGLRKVIRRSIEFELLVQHEIDMALAETRAVHNLYRLSPPKFLGGEPATGESEEPAGRSFEEEVSDGLEHAMEDPGSAYDSHPTPSQRIAWCERLEGAPTVSDDGRPAWELLQDATVLQEKMTQTINIMVEQFREVDPNYYAPEE